MNFYNFLYNTTLIPAGIILKALLQPILPKLKERERNWRKVLLNAKLEKQSDEKRVWFHVSSMGEFEQAKPVIELIKFKKPHIKIICSFYSPSGYNNQKKYPFADEFLYMPFDTKGNAKLFIDKIKPDYAVFVRYELWKNHLTELKDRDIPAILIDATSPKDSIINKLFFIKSFFRSNYKIFDTIYTVSLHHTQYFDLMKLQIPIVTMTDTRFDRIYEKVQTARKSPILKHGFFKQGDFVFVAGSTWEEDENIIIKAINRLNDEGINNIRAIIVPHEPTDEVIEELKSKLPNNVLLSEVLEFIEKGKKLEEFSDKNIITDSIGKLLSLYANAHAAYIGGAFGAGVHSVTEPAGYGIPLACGPKCDNSADTLPLTEKEALTVVNDENDLYDWLKLMIINKNLRDKLGVYAGQYVNSRIGSSKLISEVIIQGLYYENY